MTQFVNNQWSEFIDGGESSILLNRIHTMAANDTHLYCFYNTHVFPYEYKTNNIITIKQLPFTVSSAKTGSTIRVDHNFFYVLKRSYIDKNEKFVHIHSLFSGILSKTILDSNFLDICLVENGLLAGLYFEKSNCMINVKDLSDGKLLAKVKFNIGMDNKKKNRVEI